MTQLKREEIGRPHKEGREKGTHDGWGSQYESECEVERVTWRKDHRQCVGASVMEKSSTKCLRGGWNIPCHMPF